MNHLKLLLILLLLPVFSIAQSADDITGEWLPSNGKGYIKIERFGSHYYGKLVWLREPLDPETKKPKTDRNNPDAAKRNVPLLGYTLLKNFVWDAGDKEWNGGTIYDPENGKEYSCRIVMKDKNTLDVRGYVGITMFGRSDTWIRKK
jgi:uncharacterized protein (DUF2147 family)